MGQIEVPSVVPYVYDKDDVVLLASVMLFEARDQGNIGMAVVADVIISRLDKQYRGARSIYDVIVFRDAFSYLWDDAVDVILDSEMDEAYDAFKMAESMLKDYANGNWVSITASKSCPDGATHYHRVDIEPKGWNHYTVCTTVGDHVFKYGY